MNASPRSNQGERRTQLAAYRRARVAKLLLDGMDSKSIAERLGINRKTVAAIRNELKRRAES